MPLKSLIIPNKLVDERTNALHKNLRLSSLDGYPVLEITEETDLATVPKDLHAYEIRDNYLFLPNSQIISRGILCNLPFPMVNDGGYNIGDGLRPMGKSEPISEYLSDHPCVQKPAYVNGVDFRGPYTDVFYVDHDNRTLVWYYYDALAFHSRGGLVRNVADFELVTKLAEATRDDTEFMALLNGRCDKTVYGRNTPGLAEAMNDYRDGNFDFAFETIGKDKKAAEYILRAVDEELLNERRGEPETTIRIYQIQYDRPNAPDAMFRSYKEAMASDSKIDEHMYNLVWEETNDLQTLDDIWQKFNIRQPELYPARSMSVSDVVEVVDSNRLDPGFYYADDRGWVKIPFDKAKCPVNDENTIEVLECYPNRTARVKRIEPTLEGLQKEVDGYIEYVYPFEDADMAIVCNEEGKCIGLDPNRSLKDSDGNMVDFVAGPFVVLNCSDCERPLSLTKEQLQTAYETYRFPELIHMKDGEMVAEPYDPLQDMQERQTR